MSSIAQEAGAWLYRLKDDRSEECRAEFAAWAQRSPQHVAEFLLVTATDMELGAVDSQRKFDIEALLGDAASNVSPLTPAPLPQGERGKRRDAVRGRTPLLAASILLAAIALVWWQSYRASVYSTEIGEQRTIKLEDGSVVELNTRSRIEVRYTGEARTVRLVEGEALFTAAQERARPFEVQSGATTVQAIGTQFNVYRRAKSTTVSVVEGRVRVLSNAQPLLLGAGQQAAVVAGGHATKSAVSEVARAVAWRQRHLEFRSASVGEVATEFNRYNRLQIRIADESIASRRMSGLFEADEPQSLLDFLSNEGGVRFEKQEGGVTVHAQSP